MGIREVLQTEIWSKETSRKILARIWKAFRVVGIGVGVVLAGFFLFAFSWAHWLTASERSKGRMALVQVDELQNFVGASDEEFDSRLTLAKLKIQEASFAAATGKDTQVADLLYIYMEGIQNLRFEKKMHERWKSPHDYVPSKELQESAEKNEELERDEIKTLKGMLHESLDK